MKGRRPKPAAVKIADGNPGCRPIPEEPKPKPGPVKPPSELDQMGRRVWKRITAELEHMSLLASADQDMIAAFCQAVVVHKRATKQINKEGLTFHDDKGNIKRHPAQGIAAQAATLIDKLGGMMGLSPVARARLGKLPEKDEPQDPLEAFLAKHSQPQAPAKEGKKGAA